MRRAPRGVGARSNRRRPVVLHALPVRPPATSTTSGARARTRHRARARGTPQQRPLREAFRKNDRRATDAARTKAAEPQRHVRSWYYSINVRVAPGRDDRFCRSLESAIRNGLDLRVLGWGVKWEGLSQKLGAALRAVEELPADCPVVFTDAYDVFTQGESAMRKRLLMISKRIWSSRRNAAAGRRSRGIEGKTCRDGHPPSPTPYRYLNSGSWAGKASVAAKFLRAIGAGASTKDFPQIK